MNFFNEIPSLSKYFSMIKAFFFLVDVTMIQRMTKEPCKMYSMSVFVCPYICLLAALSFYQYFAK